MRLTVGEARRHIGDKAPIDHQTTILLSQVKLSADSYRPPYGESRWHCGDDVYEKCSFMNDESTRWAEDPPVMDKEQGTGDMPVCQQAKHPEKHRGAFLGHQKDIDLFQVQLPVEANVPSYGESRWCQRDTIYERRPNANNKAKRQVGACQWWTRGRKQVTYLLTNDLCAQGHMKICMMAYRRPSICSKCSCPQIEDPRVWRVKMASWGHHI
jgi:hypothetical protein